ncbi:MAG: YtxH domain-containing protein [Trichloromonadaceae bacterium]
MKHRDLAVAATCGLGVGLVLGAAAALLLAPASGSETRRRLRYERDRSLDVARGTARWTLNRLHLERPESEEEVEDVAFTGA